MRTFFQGTVLGQCSKPPSGKELKKSSTPSHRPRRPRAASSFSFFPFPCNSWWGKAMGKAGSKALREASVDGIQAQVQAASSHTDMQTKADSQAHKRMQNPSRETRAKHVFYQLQKKKRIYPLQRLGGGRVCVRACAWPRSAEARQLLRSPDMARLCNRDQPRLAFTLPPHTSIFSNCIIIPLIVGRHYRAVGRPINIWWLSRVEHRQSLDVLGIMQSFHVRSLSLE